MKLFDYRHVKQPVDPPKVVSVHSMHKLETNIPFPHVVHVEPSIHTLQSVGQLKQ